MHWFLLIISWLVILWRRLHLRGLIGHTNQMKKPCQKRVEVMLFKLCIGTILHLT
nr:hypothetical protein Iba_chr02fCG8810 [Ipomoea batatas]